MANWVKTIKLSQVLQLMRIGSSNYHATDPHIHVGRGSGDKSNWTGRGQFGTTVIDSDWWPASGKIVDATISGKTGATANHGAFRGSNAGIEVRALTEKGTYGSASTQDGYYTSQGSGDVYPGASTTATGSVTFGVSSDSGKSFSRSIRAIVEARMPKRIARRNGAAGGGGKFYGVQVRSANEDSSSRSAIITDDLYVTIEVDVDAKPSSPLVVEIVGAQEGTSGPTIVASDTGRRLEVVFAFRSEAAGDTCKAVELAVMGIGATDDTPGPVLYTTGAITPQSGGAANVHRVALTGLPLRLAGRLRVRTTSNKGKVGDWSSLDDDDAWFRLGTIPGAPLDIVIQPFTDSSHVLFSLNSSDPDDTVSGGRAIYTLIPQGTLAWDSGMVDIGGSTRRADLVYGGVPLADGQRVSVRVQTRNQDGSVGALSAPKEQTMRDRRGPTVTPDPGRLKSRRPTFTISDALFDGHRERLLQPDDSSSVILDSGGQTVTNLTTVNWQVPAGVLAYGQRFALVASTLPDGGSVYGVESNPQAYSIGSLPVCGVSIVDAYLRRVQTRDIPIVRTVTDPDGAAISGIDMEIRVAATPAGSGALIERRWDTGSIPAVARLGRNLDLLTSATGWTGETNVAPGTANQQPTGYSGNSLELVLASSSTDRGARLTYATPLDLSAYGTGTLWRIHRRCTSVTNLVRWTLRFEFASASDWAEYELIASGGTINTWAEVVVAKGNPRATNGTVDWSAVRAVRLFADVSAAYAGNLQVRDLRIGTTQTAKTAPDGHLAWEAGIDVRVRATNDLDDLASTTLGSQANAGATTISLASATGIAIGQTIVIAGTVPEVREITNLVTTTATLSDALTHTHASGQAVKARPFAQPTPWATVSALQPPAASLVSPADAATITRPWTTLEWSASGHGGRTIVSATVTVSLDGDGIWSRTLDGTKADLPARLLDTDSTYTWSVTVVDSGGLVTTTAARSFDTDFTTPDTPPSLSADAAEDGSGIVLTWDDSDDPDLHHWEASWQRDDGSWQRIDGGPESLDDGRLPLLVGTLTHVGARLGDNSYALAQHNGWAASETVSADAILEQPAGPGGTWQAVPVDGEMIRLRTMAAPRVTEGVIEGMQPPGGEAHEVHWGLGRRRVSMRVDTAPYADGALSVQLRLLMADVLRGRPATPVWLKAPAGWQWDPMWMSLQSMTDEPGIGGRMSVSLEWAEIGAAVHSILPPPPEPEEPEPVVEPHASLDLDSIDFGEEVIS